MTIQSIFSRQLEDNCQHAVYDLKDARPSSNGMAQEALFVSDTGGKAENQDAFGVFESHDGARVYVVADGLGGHKGGRIASELAVQAIAGFVQTKRVPVSDSTNNKAAFQTTSPKQGFAFDDPTCYIDAFKQANQTLLDAQAETPELSKMRTTLVILAIKDGLAFWTHVGDVRLYLFRERQITFQTRDHSVPQMLADSGEIEHSEIRHHPDRSKLLNALGNPACKPSIPTRYMQLQPGDIFHLSTDGYWEWVMENTLIQCLSRPQPLNQVAAELEKQVRQTASEIDPSHDNYTACHVRIHQAERNLSYWHKTAFIAP